jgi:hypothetical protein
VKLDAGEVLAHKGLVEWLAFGERGVSSNTIVQTLTGIPAATDGWLDHPMDPGDFRRCELLLRQVPTLRPLMPAMGARSRQWAALVAHWDELVQLCEADLPGIFTDHAPNGRCARAYARMNELGC